jgi:hypothetical protein
LLTATRTRGELHPPVVADGLVRPPLVNGPRPGIFGQVYRAIRREAGIVYPERVQHQAADGSAPSISPKPSPWTALVIVDSALVRLVFGSL